MLHILWVILKIILIILGVLLGLLLLLGGLVLFCPIRYRGEGHREKELRAKARVTWLFRIFSFSVEYAGGEPVMAIRIFGISLKTYQRFGQSLGKLFKKRRAASSRKMKKKGPDTPGAPEEDFLSDESVSEQRQPEEDSHPLIRLEEEEEPRPDGEVSAGGFHPISAIYKFIQKIWEILRSVIRIPGKIFRGIGKILASLQNFRENIEKWKLFLDDERTRDGLSLGWGELKKLLRHLGPTKISGKITFGTEDPSLTGRVLGIFGMTLPLHKNTVEIVPVFGENVLEGDVWLKGRIYLAVFVKTAIKLYFDKNIKFMLKAMKKEG